MKIEEIRKLKKELERNITIATKSFVEEFTNKSGLYINSIDIQLDTFDIIGEEFKQVVVSKTNVRIEI